MRAKYQMEYRALNLLDEVCTVEITILEDEGILHIFDKEEAIVPIYNFTENQYELSEDFYKMANVLLGKKILMPKDISNLSVDDWINRLTVYFYSKRCVQIYTEKVFESVALSDYQKLEEDGLIHTPYLLRIGTV